MKIAQREQPARLVAIADPDALQQAAQAMDLPLRLRHRDDDCGPGELALIELPQPQRVQFGRPAAGNARAVIDALLLGGKLCLDGEFDGLVTGPVNKASINAGGIDYCGTTELLAEQAGVDVLMMLASDSLRVALLTTHLPLRQVPDAVTMDVLQLALRILHEALRAQFGLQHPRIAVLGLNPHAGESGVLGSEEIEIIIPVLDALRATGMDLAGPLPADTAFLPQMLAHFDAVLAMYHDQGLPVLKHAGFEKSVNITLGLPYPRVAVDHGTALDIAGQGIADPSSLQAAVNLCARLAVARASR